MLNLDNQVASNRFRMAFALTFLFVTGFERNLILYQYGLLLFFAALILFERLLLNFYFWATLTVYLAVFLGLLWYTIDNLSFLIFYWWLGYTLYLAIDRPTGAFRTFTQLLIGTIFLFAVIWKLISPDFISGEFYEWEFMTDKRLGPVAVLLVKDYTFQEYQENVQLTEQSDALAKNPVKFTFHEEFTRLAKLFTFATLFLELLVAILFLLPVEKLRAWRTASLLIFILSAYPVVPVTQFGGVLCAMGIAQSKRRHEVWAYSGGVIWVFLVGVRTFFIN